MKAQLIAGLLVSLGIFLGRVSGFFREVYIGTTFGASGLTDTIIVILTMPDVLINLLVSGALGMALIPELTSRDRDAALNVYRQALLLFLSMASIVVLFLSFFSTSLLDLLLQSQSHEVNLTYSDVFSISLIAFPLTVAAGVTTAYLHSNDKFFVPSLGTLIFNSVILACLAFLSFNGAAEPLKYITLAIVLGAALRWVMQIVNSGVLPFGLRYQKTDLHVSGFLKRYISALSCSGVIFFVPIYVRSLNSGQGEGEVAFFNFAIKLVEFPLGVLLTVFSIVLFPQLAKLVSANKMDEYNSRVKQVSLAILAVSLAVLSSMQNYAEEIVSLIFGWGEALSPEDLSTISSYLSVLIVSLPFQGINSFLISAYAAKKDMTTPLWISLFCGTILAVITTTQNLESSDLLIRMVSFYIALSILLVLGLHIKHNIGFGGHFIFDLALIILVFFIFNYFAKYIPDTESLLISAVFASLIAAGQIITSFMVSRDFRAALVRK